MYGIFEMDFFDNIHLSSLRIKMSVSVRGQLKELDVLSAKVTHQLDEMKKVK